MTDKDSYGQILKSSSIMGGAAGINMLLGMVRVKFAAVLIGTGGVGLLANFMAIQKVIGTIAGLGLHSSGVRDVVSAVAKNDQLAIGRAVLTLRRMCWLTGLLGMSAMMILSPFLSQWTFGSEDYSLHIALLGLIVLFGNLAGGQGALIQGMRRIGDMARINIIGATFGTVVSISLYLWLGIKGIVPALVIISAFQLAVSWHFARRVSVPKVRMTWVDSFREAGGMVQLGIFMMWTGLVASISVYIINTMITNQISLEAVGIYSAAYVLSGMFVNFVLQAMGTDYYPRLTSVSNDKVAMNRLVNEQAEIGLLLAVPGLLGTLCLAPWVIHIFYTSEFLLAADLLQWFILGCLGRVLSWPLGYVILAKGEGPLYFFVETSFHLLYLTLAFFGLKVLGIEGVAVAFFVSYISYIAFVYAIARKLVDFYWATEMRRLILILLPSFAAGFIATRFLSVWPATFIGVVITVCFSILCMRELVNRIGYEHSLTRMVCRIPGVRTACGLSK